MKIDFYQVEMPDGAPKLSELIKIVSQMPDDDSRVRQSAKGEWTARLQEATHSNRRWEAEMVRIRMDAVPVIASLSGDVKPIDLDDDEGIGEETAFLFDESSQILLLQRNRFGVSANMFCRYFEQIGSLEGPIFLTPVMETSALEHLLRFKEIRKYTVRFAGATDPTLYTKDSDDDEQAIELLANATVPSIEITMSMGHERGSLPLKSVFQKVKELLTGSPAVEPTKIAVDGTLESGERDGFDLTAFAVTESEEVEADSHRRLLYNGRKAALRSAWSKREKELRKRFPEARK